MGDPPAGVDDWDWVRDSRTGTGAIPVSRGEQTWRCDYCATMFSLSASCGCGARRAAKPRRAGTFLLENIRRGLLMRKELLSRYAEDELPPLPRERR